MGSPHFRGEGGLCVSLTPTAMSAEVFYSILLLEGPLTPKQIGTLCEDCKGLILLISSPHARS